MEARKMTDDLINRLTGELKPVSRHAMQRLLLGHALLGMVAGVVIMLAFLGARHDLAAAMATPAFWSKLCYAALLLAVLLPALFALSRPLRQNLPWPALLLIFSCLGAAAIYQWEEASPEVRPVLVWGYTALVCPWLIGLISLPTLASLLLAIRKLAPARPTLAGFAAGLVSGGIGVLVYAFHCPESGLPFIALWYTLGIVGTGVLGALGGRFCLRW
ncbi:extracytoplasmic function alternative sigma factor [Brucella abortus str. 2308 A]|nr:extracytoplasmic function alternative sigma factor [Brucella abortus str. 2308 A]